MHFHLLQPPSSGHLPFPRRQFTLYLNLKTTMTCMSSKGRVRRDYHHQQEARLARWNDD